MRQSGTSDRLQKILDNFNDTSISKKLLEKINLFKKNVSIMEVCGTHTVAIFRSGIRYGLPKNINLVSGPGCPVCVTPTVEIEKAIGLACKKNVTLFCFGDMVKVPGINETLETAKAKMGANVKIMYSPMEALDYAESNKKEVVVLLGVGFETTIPLFCSVITRAKNNKVKNLFLLSAFKLVPPALDALCSSKELKIDGFILPGHVSAIIGEEAYVPFMEKYRIPAVITGFEPVDILEGIYLLAGMISSGERLLKNQYKRVVSFEGNQKAQALINSVFRPCDSEWRGLGTIKNSGLSLSDDFKAFDAEALIDFDVPDVKDPKGCLCGDIIKGVRKPIECKLYKKVCTPESPVGPCMVSSEGTCAAYYKYGG
ncbi:MAG: hydrogenase formation protein HypD [Candidatus Omnitrophica bacterium]|nr:hydrogenase formation protein HypD [Candidatus Omnitrophota bacterium]